MPANPTAAGDIACHVRGWMAGDVAIPSDKDTHGTDSAASQAREPRGSVLRVAQVVASIESEAAGISYSVPRLSQSIAALGHDVTLMSLGAPDLTATRFTGSGRYIHCKLTPDAVWPSRLKKLGRSRQMRQALLASEADLFHTHGLWMMPNVYPAEVSRGVRRPLVLSPRGMLGADALAFSSSIKRAFWALWQARAASQVACFHATADQEYEDIRAFGLSQAVAVIPNGIDLPEIPFSEIRSRAPFVLSLGRIHPIKGLDRLVTAWGRIEEEFPKWRLRIVGPSEAGCAEALQRQVQALGLSSVSIEEPAFGNAKLELMRQAELFVLSTLRENFGMTVAESLALEVPVISTKGAPWRGLVENSCGWWIDHGVDPLVAALREAIRLPPGERHAMGRNGRNWMKQDFGWPAMAEQMSAVYRWLVSGGERPQCVKVDP